MTSPDSKEQVATGESDIAPGPVAEALPKRDDGKPDAPPRIVDALRIRNFRLFFFGAFVSNLGTWLQSVPLSWLVLEMTDSAFWVALVPVSQFGPMLLLGLPGGAAADRFERKKVLLVTQTVMLTSAAVLSYITFTGRASLVTVFPPVILTGVALAFNMPAFQAFIGDLVPRHHVPSAISLNSLQFSLGRVIGPAIAGYILATSGITGGIIVEASGPATAFAINSMSYLAVIGALLLIRVAPHERTQKFTKNSFLGGFKTARETPVIGTLIAVAMAMSLFSAPMISLLPVFARNVLNKGAGAYGTLFAVFAMGTALGSVMSPRLVRQLGYNVIVIGGTLTQGAVLAGFALNRWFPLALGLIVIYGSMHGTILAATSSGLQMASPPRRRGRVMSLFLMAFAGLYPLGALIGGTTAQGVGVPVTMLIAAGFLGCSSLVWFKFRERLSHVGT